jgi:hypothetical protein
VPTSIYTTFRGKIRIYDGSPTPQYFELPWVQPDLRALIARPRPVMTLRLDRGGMNTFTHYTRGSDEPIAAPQAVTFTSWLDEQMFRHVTSAICNIFDDAIWQVGTATFVTAAGTGADILSGASTLVPVPQMADDATHRRVHVEFLWQGRIPGTNDYGFRHEECYFPRELQSIADGDPATWSATYWVYGAMTDIEDFTTGTNVTPAIV